jgi:hypothetical protein
MFLGAWSAAQSTLSEFEGDEVVPELGHRDQVILHRSVKLPVMGCIERREISIGAGNPG